MTMRSKRKKEEEIHACAAWWSDTLSYTPSFFTITGRWRKNNSHAPSYCRKSDFPSQTYHSLYQGFKVLLYLILWFQRSGAVWKSRWPSWAPVPNKPYGLCGRKATLNQPMSYSFQCGSTETVRTIRDGEPRTAISTYTQLLSFEILRVRVHRT